MALPECSAAQIHFLLLAKPGVAQTNLDLELLFACRTQNAVTRRARLCRRRASAGPVTSSSGPRWTFRAGARWGNMRGVRFHMCILCFFSFLFPSFGGWLPRPLKKQKSAEAALCYLRLHNTEHFFFFYLLWFRKPWSNQTRLLWAGKQTMRSCASVFF